MISSPASDGEAIRATAANVAATGPATRAASHVARATATLNAPMAASEIARQSPVSA